MAKVILVKANDVFHPLGKTWRAFILSADCPRRILAYGKMHREERNDWESLGASVREYVDYNERSRRGGLNRVR